MADEPDNPTPDTTTATPPQAPATPAPQTVTMTVEEFEAQKNAAAAAARRAEQARQKQPEPPKAQPKSDPAPAPSGLTAEDVERIADRRAEFARAVERHKLNAAAENLLRVAFKAENPENVSEWMARQAAAFGTSATQPTTPAPSAQATAPAPTTAAQPGTPPPAHPAPAATNPMAPPVSVFDFNEDQMRAYMRSKGANPANPYSTESRKIQRELRTRALADGATIRVVAPK